MLRQVLKTKVFELTLVPRSWENLKSAFLGAGHDFRPSAEEVGRRMPIIGHEITGRYIMISAGDLGLKESVQRVEIYDLARRDGLRECHPQAGWELMIINRVWQFPVRDLLIGANPIEMRPNYHLLLEIRNGQTMTVDAGGKTVKFREEREWLFKVA